jgi:hypothetical protein
MPDNYKRTLSTAELEETPRVVLEQAVGDVHITGWDRQEIQISISDEDELFDVEQSGPIFSIRSLPPTRRARELWEPALEGLKDLEIGLERVASRVERKVQRKMRHLHRGIAQGFSVNLGRWTSGLDYEIKVPHNCNVTLRTSTGDIAIHEVNGTIFAQATSGDITLGDISGTALVNSASGDIHIDTIEGKLGAHTASGDLHIDEANLSELSVHTASGDINLDLKRLPEGEWGIKTVSGDLRLKIPRESRLTVEVQTLSGDVDCDLPHERVRLGTARGKQLIINGGGPFVRLQSVSGDVLIDSNDRRDDDDDDDNDNERGFTVDLSRGRRPEDRVESEIQAQRRQAELDVLQAVERGELSPQEAMDRLRTIGR